MTLSPDSAAHEHLINRFLRRLLALLTLKHALLLSAGWCFAWGLAVLLLRVVAGTPRKPLLWGALGLVAVVVVAWLLARRELPARSSVRALLDGQNDCGGLLMAAESAALGAWQTRVPAIVLPKLRWRSARAWGLCVAALVFVGVSLAVPIRLAALNAGRSLDVHREVETLSAQIEALKQAEILEETKADALEQKLAQLAADASGEDPAKTWEALDHLADAVEKNAQDAAEAAQAKQEQLARAAALAEGLQTGKDQLDAKTMTEAMQTMSQMMQSALNENSALAQSLSAETQEAIKNGSLSQEQLKEIGNALSQNKAGLQQRLSKLNQAGLKRPINPNALKGNAQAGNRDNAGLAKFLKENAEKMSVEEAIGEWCENPGKGGVNRGRGDAAMTWSDGSSEKDAKFKEQVLPPSAVAGLNDSQLVGLSAAAPTVNGQAVTAHGALNGAAAGGGSAYTQPVLPRHKGAVKRYFDRPQK